MRASGQKVTEEELQQIIKEVDLDGDGTINFKGNAQRLGKILRCMDRS